MGQYFIAVNEDKKEWLHPHRFGDGFKFMEFAMSDSGFLMGLALLMRRSNQGGGGDWNGYHAPAGALNDYPIVGSWAGDSVSIVGDYDESNLFQIAMGEVEGKAGWRDVSEPIIEALCRDTYAKEKLRVRLNWWKDNTSENSPERQFYERVFGDVSQKPFQAKAEDGAFKEGSAELPSILRIPGFQSHE